jgi:hypothetical protein
VRTAIEAPQPLTLLSISDAVCAKSAQKSANPERGRQTGCKLAGYRPAMGNIIRIQFRQSRLPRRLLRDGWWLQSPPVRPDLEMAHHDLTPAARVPGFGPQKEPDIHPANPPARGARGWRLARYLANNPDMPPDPPNGGGG